MRNMYYNFEGKTFFVTGATSGIGRDLCLFITKNNGKVAIISRSNDKFLDLKNFLGDSLILNIQVDLSEITLIGKSLEILKNSSFKFSGFIHCAGIADARPLMLMDNNFYQKMFNINFFSFLEITKYFVKYNLLENPSSIVAISSIQSQYGDKAKVLYGASKGAIESAVKSLAKELYLKGIRVNSVVPGFIKTELYSKYEDLIGTEKIQSMISNHQYLGLGSTYDVINAIAFLLSVESKFITGTNLVVDGGWLS